MNTHERKAVAGLIIPTVLLFLTGIAFGYFITLPYVLRFLVGFQGNVGPIKPMITVNEYFDLVLGILLSLGIVFEVGIMIYFLTLFGFVSTLFLLKNSRYAILIIAVVAAIVTPTPDATTMLVFMMPMIGLYFVGIIVSAVAVRKKKKREAAEQTGTAG